MAQVILLLAALATLARAAEPASLLGKASYYASGILPETFGSGVHNPFEEGDPAEPEDSDAWISREEEALKRQALPKQFRNDTVYSGYFKIGEGDQDMFYTLFESRNDQDREEQPLLIWIRGEAGSSPSASLGSRSAPYLMTVNESTGLGATVTNPVSWNNFSNVLYLDSPVGTGFSFLRNDYGHFATLDIVVRDFIHFLKQFLNFHSGYQERDIYIAGQDLAGKYIPAFVKAIKEVKAGTYEDAAFEEKYLPDSKKEWTEWIILKGIILIGPLIDDVSQREMNSNFAEKRGLINDVTGFFMDMVGKWCREALINHRLWEQAIACTLTDSFVTGNPLYPTFDTRNIKQECPYWITCYQNDYVLETAMNSPDLIETLQVNNSGPAKFATWMWTDYNPFDAWTQLDQYYKTSEELIANSRTFQKDPTWNYTQRYEINPRKLLEEVLQDGEVKVLILSGDLDYAVNHKGIEALLGQLEWDDSPEFTSALANARDHLWWYRNTTQALQLEEETRKIPRDDVADATDATKNEDDKKKEEPKDKTVHLGGDFAHSGKLTYMRVFRAGLNIIDEKPDLMYSLLQEWFGSKDGGLSSDKPAPLS